MVTAAKSNHRMPKKETPATRSEARAAADGQPSMRTMLDANPTLKNTVAQIEKQFGEGAIMPLGSGQRRHASRASPPAACRWTSPWAGRAFPAGRVVEIFGPESSGKTTLALHVVAQRPARRRHRRLHRRRARPGPQLGQEAGRRAGNAAGQPAGQRRRGHAHHRDADQVQRRRRDRHRLGGRPGAARRNWKARSATRTSACRPG